MIYNLISVFTKKDTTILLLPIGLIIKYTGFKSQLVN